MEWNQIIGFYNVAKLGGFTKAAESTYKTQSALTYQVKALEIDLDCLLFERIGKRKIRLTPAGEKLYEYAEELIEKYKLFIEDLNVLKGERKGQLKIAAPFTTLYHMLPELIQRYSKTISLGRIDNSRPFSTRSDSSSKRGGYRSGFGSRIEGTKGIELSSMERN